jgi:glycosyltransferase involved in cell wall biosynthesis
LAEDRRRPKILVVIGTLAHMGGAERQALYLVEHLKNLGVDVEVLAFEDGSVIRQELDALGVKAMAFSYYFRWPKAKRARALFALTRLLRNEVRPDALLPFVGIHSKTIAQAWPYTNAKFCWWNQQDEGRDLTGTPVEARLLRKVSSINSNSFAGRDFLAATYGLAPESIHVYNNGTPLPSEIPSAGAWRTALSLGRRKIVSMIANVTAYKDHATLIDAWPRVASQFDDESRPVLLLAGHLRERDTADALKIRAFERGLSGDDIRFLGPVDDVASLLADSDLVVHSSLTEGCPNAVCEAMAMERAVVATDIPGTRQALGDGGARWLAAPRDADDLASRIIVMLQNDELRREEARRNRERIASEFRIDSMNAFFQREIERGLGYPLE